MKRLRTIWPFTAVVAASVVLAGCGGGDSGGDAAPKTDASAKASRKAGLDEEGGDTSAKSSSSPAPAGPTGTASQGLLGGGPLGGAGGGGQQKQAAVTPPKNTSPPRGARPDPFMPWFSTTPPPEPVLSLVAPVRIASMETVAPSDQPGITVNEAASRRVAGILNGNGIYALLDSGGTQEIVYPGKVLDDGYRVEKIDSNSVTLKRTANTQTFIQVIPLTDANSAAVAFSGPTGGRGGAMPGRGAIGGIGKGGGGNIGFGGALRGAGGGAGGKE